MTKIADKTTLIIFVCLATPLLMSYLGLSLQSKEMLKNIWSNNGTNMIKEYKLYYPFVLSMLIAAAAGCYLFYYLSLNDESTKKRYFDKDYEEEGKLFIYSGLLVLLGFSLLWIPSFYMFKKSSTFLKYLPNITLFMVAMGAGFLLTTIASGVINDRKKNDKKMSNYDKGAIASATYLFFHTFVMDFLIWNGIV